MKIERLRAKLENGAEVVVIKTTLPMPGSPHLDQLPSFALATGERLTPQPGDTALTLFTTLRGTKVTIIR
jgi:hypothetical protein